MSSNPKKSKLSTEGTSVQAQPKQEYHQSLKDIDEIQSQMSFLSEKLNLEICKMECLREIEKQHLYERREQFINQIPNFWFNSLMNHPMLSKLLLDAEEELFSQMSKIEICVLDGDPMTYVWKIMFYFKENPFFKNTTLIKEYLFEITGAKYNKTINVTPVIWKEGRDMTEQLKERKSLLAWLTCKNYAGNDLEIAQVLKDDLWMNPLPFYLIGDHEPDDHSDEVGDSDGTDIIVIDDSDDEKSTTVILDDDDSDVETEDYGSADSSDVIQIIE